jgi:hypothetical protein
MALQIADTAPDSRPRRPRADPLPRLDRRLAGGPLLAPEGLHARLHDGARIHGEHQAGVRSQERQDHPALGRPGRQPPKMGPRHRGHAGRRAQLSDHRRRRLQRLEALRNVAAATSGDAAERTPADNQTVRNVFVIGPDKKIKLILVYPMTTGRNFDEVLRVIDSLQLTATHKVATPVNWKEGDDVIIAGSVSDDEAREAYPRAGRPPSRALRIVPQPR